MLGQRCVKWEQETGQRLTIPHYLRMESDAIALFTTRCLIWDPHGDLDNGVKLAPAAEAPVPRPVPIFGATHGHRHIRGSVLTDNGWVKLSEASAAYASTFCDLLARCYTARSPRSTVLILPTVPGPRWPRGSRLRLIS